MSPRPATLRLATLNVCGLPPVLSRLPPLEDRAAEIGKRIEASNLDVFNLQEVWGGRSLATLRNHLPSFPFVAWQRAVHGGPAGGLVTFSRHPLGEPRFRSFGGTAPRTSSIAFRAQRAINARRQGMLSVPITGWGVVVGNVHLTANKDGDWSPGNRYFVFHRDQLVVLHEFMGGARTPETELTVVSGDFNIASDSALYTLITDDGAWRDPFAGRDIATYHPAFLPAGATGHRIDYVLLSGDETRFPVLDSETLFAEQLTTAAGTKIWATDHVGLTVRIALSQTGEVSGPS
ncbi:endonuclease/exonuclease/phosphatase family protein [Cryptosporangium aurantiacum]|uniref:Metal-dependent hydrolase, endonuclease/exonuclease/phosphatase family n=1 Tax=Cryptosporangium aurantiacum TaxID=134849 RepID=A0A1M7RLD8_9ACTN|nr:endonuclease/exonuclease/phosphatase family protein [Cryptosporangium aurantiacum]SHN46982.1 Metal-dependent hydrolase, endonuclease/exonuclease/phosphatase family [Cryptosporangium aurantiacum]